MAGAMRKMAVYLGLVEDEERGEYDEYYDDEPYDEPAAVRQHPAAARPARAPEAERTMVASYAAPRTATAVAEPMELNRITTLHPRTYNEARVIGEQFREGVPVIMDLTEMDDTDAKRLVDFAAGLIFGLRGSIERITNKVFLLTPVNVEITAEDKSRLAEGGFFNQS